MSAFDYKSAADYWVNIDKKGKQMPREELIESINKFINTNDTCAMATATDDLVRCTPIEYKYVNGKFYLISEGGLKFKALEKNKNVSLAIYDKFSGFSNLKGLQVTGVAEVIEDFSLAYEEGIKARGLNLETLKKRSAVVHLIIVTPTKVEFTNADFKDLGYFVRQTLE